MFDPNAFMQTTVEDTFEETRTLIPAAEYMMVAEDVEAKVVGENNLPILNARFAITNTGNDELDGRKVYHTFWLDIDERGNLMTGPNKNVKLGQFLGALGLNGKPWAPAQLQGTVVLANLTHRVNKRSGDMEESITQFAKAS